MPVYVPDSTIRYNMPMYTPNSQGTIRKIPNDSFPGFRFHDEDKSRLDSLKKEIFKKK